MKKGKNYSGTIYVNVDVEVEPYEVINELSDADLIDELVSRGYTIKDDNDIDVEIVSKNIISHNKYDFKRNICDVLDLNYHVSNDDILKKIKENLY
jgi:hypothetical protein